MNSLYILDTDHLSLLQRGPPFVLARLASVPIAWRAVTIITVDEQLQGRLAVVRTPHRHPGSTHCHNLPCVAGNPSDTKPARLQSGVWFIH